MQASEVKELIQSRRKEFFWTHNRKLIDLISDLNIDQQTIREIVIWLVETDAFAFKYAIEVLIDTVGWTKEDYIRLIRVLVAKTRSDMTFGHYLAALETASKKNVRLTEEVLLELKTDSSVSPATGVLLGTLAPSIETYNAGFLPTAIIMALRVNIAFAKQHNQYCLQLIKSIRKDDKEATLQAPMLLIDLGIDVIENYAALEALLRSDNAELSAWTTSQYLSLNSTGSPEEWNIIKFMVTRQLRNSFGHIGYFIATVGTARLDDSVSLILEISTCDGRYQTSGLGYALQTLIEHDASKVLELIKTHLADFDQTQKKRIYLNIPHISDTLTQQKIHDIFQTDLYGADG